MDANDLHADGFYGWSRFSRKTKEQLMKSIPRKIGVYVIRCTTPAKRLRGSSDIVYVGSAQPKRLEGRLGQYYCPGPTQSTNKRIIELVGDSDHYEIGWCVVSSKSDAVSLEQRLLERYANEHGERPPQKCEGLKEPELEWRRLSWTSIMNALRRCQPAARDRKVDAGFPGDVGRLAVVHRCPISVWAPVHLVC